MSCGVSEYEPGAPLTGGACRSALAPFVVPMSAEYNLHRIRPMALTFTPYLNFNNQCAEAFRFYHQILGGELTIQTFGESLIKDHVPSELHNLVFSARLIIDGSVLAGFDVRPDVTVKQEGFEVAIAVSDPGEADRIYAALSAGGEVTMPLQETIGARRFGMVTDPYGVPWMVTCE